MSLPLAVSWAAWAALGLGWARLTREDLLHKKIRHGHLLLLLFAAGTLWLALAGGTVLGVLGKLESFHLWGYYAAAARTLAFSAAAALALWRLGVWPAGDAKLFAALAVLAPLTDERGQLVRLGAPIDALVNAFLPAAAWTVLLAARYGWRSRLRHQAAFLRQLGPRRGLDFAMGALSSAKSALAGVRSEPREAVFWLSAALLGGSAAHLGLDLPDNPLARSLLFFLFFWAWGRLARNLGTTLPLLVSLAAAGWAMRRAGAGPVLLESFRMAFFGVFLWAGSRLAGRSLGGTADALPWGLAGLALGPLGALLARVSGSGGTLLLWLGLGLAFGIGAALVRLWETDLRHEVSPEEVVRGVTLAPAFVERMRTDEDFDEEEFGRLYPDGLTDWQAEEVRAYCERHGLGGVPVTPTVSFAFWIFLGWVLARLLGGNVLAALA